MTKNISMTVCMYVWRNIKGYVINISPISKVRKFSLWSKVMFLFKRSWKRSLYKCLDSKLMFYS